MILSQDLQALQSLLACAPLSPPVDYYNLTSKFGNRKDPFTKNQIGMKVLIWEHGPEREFEQPHLALSPLLVVRVGMVDLFL